MRKYSAQVSGKVYGYLPFEEPKSQDIVMDMQDCLANILSKRRTERGCCIRRCEQVLTGDLQGRHHRTLLMARTAVLVSMLHRSYFYFIFFFCYQQTCLYGVASFSATLQTISVFPFCPRVYFGLLVAWILSAIGLTGTLFYFISFSYLNIPLQQLPRHGPSQDLLPRGQSPQARQCRGHECAHSAPD